MSLAYHDGKHRYLTPLGSCWGENFAQKRWQPGKNKKNLGHSWHVRNLRLLAI